MGGCWSQTADYQVLGLSQWSTWCQEWSLHPTKQARHSFFMGPISFPACVRLSLLLLTLTSTLDTTRHQRQCQSASLTQKLQILVAPLTFLKAFQRVRRLKAHCMMDTFQSLHLSNHIIILLILLQN